ncbi:MAG: DNA polymerase III subunit alpha [Chromatiales bacterium]
MPADFAHLRLHTEYSISDGLIRIESLIQAVVRAGMPAVAVTDEGNLFAMVKAYQAAQAAGVKPIIGADVWLRGRARPGQGARLTLLAKDRTGYRHLAALLTRSYTEGQEGGVPHLEREWLAHAHSGLIALSGAREGDVGQALLAGNTALAAELASQWRGWFGDRYYIELQRTGRAREEEYIEAAVQMAGKLALPVVATNDVRFLAMEDYEAHEARVCIHEGRTLADPRRPRRYSSQQYLRSPAEMAALFSDVPEALANATHIAARCSLELSLGTYHLPAFPTPGGCEAGGWLRQEAARGLEARLPALLDATGTDFRERRRTYYERLRAELDVITRMGFAGYFLIVADFIGWAKNQGIPVGPGRGSGAGSLTAFALGITELDPIRYDLLFERFLNPERVSMPDFDVDFCMDRRDEVIQYVAERYGRDRVSQIITHGTMAAKAVVRDVGRVLGLPYGFVDQIAKLIPFALDMTLERALREEPALRERYDKEEEVRSLIDLALKLEGLTRSAGRHAGGVVIAPSALSDFMPLYCEQGASTAVTQLDMGDVEAIGLVKFDFLGLRTLTIIDWAVKEVNRERLEQGVPPLDINRLPLDDKHTYQIFAYANTTAVFQFESRGMRELLKRAKPDRFEDVVALVALYRPGPMDLIPDFIDRKHGRQRVDYVDARLQPILGPTYGVMVYQEQVMQIAQVIGGYSLGTADLLRRAMGKKKPEEMAKHRDTFVAGATRRGVPERTAQELFNLMEKFAGYGFNKSHAAAYALVAYQTAWLKAHHSAAFMAAVLSSDMDDTDKVRELIKDARRMGITVQPPAVNDCLYGFSVADAGTVRYGLGAIKGAGRSAIEAIVAERGANGRYSDLFDLCRRIDRRVNRRVLEALARAGALDELGPSRASLLASIDGALQAAARQGRDDGAGQDDLFAILDANQHGHGQRLEFTAVPDLPRRERLLAEKATLGWSPSGHLIDDFEEEIARLNVSRLAQLKPGRRRVVGIVDDVRTRPSRRGRMAIVLLDDRTASLEVTVYSELYQRAANQLVKNEVAFVEGDYTEDSYSGDYNLVADRIWSLEEMRREFARFLIVRLQATEFRNGLIQELKDIFVSAQRGRCPVLVDYQQSQAAARLRLEAVAVVPSNAILERLSEKMGPANVWVEY